MNRVNIKGSNGLFYKNMILITDIHDLVEYEESIGSGRVADVGKAIIEKIQNKSMKHHTDDLANVVEGIANQVGCGSLWLLGDIAIKSSHARLKYVSKGHSIAINHNGGWMPVSDKDIIEPIPTQYTEQDIKITKFEGGKHFYAKIRDIEVKDEFGDRKWNTYKYAENVAKEYLKKLNEKC